MQTIKIGPRNLTLGEREGMENIAAESQDAWEEDCDADGEVWTYRMLPLAVPGTGGVV